MNTLKLYGTGSATANAVAQVIIPSKGRIRGIQFSVLLDSITDNSSVQCEVSRSSAREIAVNGAQQSIAEIAASQNFVTSGLATSGLNIFCPCDIPVIQGQIIYLHAAVAGTLTYNCTALISYA